MENFKDIAKTQFLSKRSNFFNTNNVSLKKKLIKDFYFEKDILFNTINDDLVAGNILLKKGKFIYKPDVVVFHKNPDSFRKLIIKNFIQGWGDQWILDRQKINIRKIPLKYSFLKWLKVCNKESEKLNCFRKIQFWSLLFIYPIPYKIGRFFCKTGFLNFIYKNSYNYFK